MPFMSEIDPVQVIQMRNIVYILDYQMAIMVFLNKTDLFMRYFELYVLSVCVCVCVCVNDVLINLVSCTQVHVTNFL